MQKVQVEEETLRTLLTIVQGGPGVVTPSQRDSAITESITALEGQPAPGPGQLRFPV